MESTPHLFWFCPFVAQFWIKVQKFLSDYNKILNLDIFKVIMGDLEEKSKMINNKIILLGKIYIFKTQKNEPLNINRFKGFLRHHFVLESFIAQQNGSMEQHLCGWDAVSSEVVLEMLA